MYATTARCTTWGRGRLAHQRAKASARSRKNAAVGAQHRSQRCSRKAPIGVGKPVQ